MTFMHRLALAFILVALPTAFVSAAPTITVTAEKGSAVYQKGEKIFNQLQGAKEAVVLPKLPHIGVNGTQGPYLKRFAVWTKALVAGQPPPIAAAQP